MVDNSGQPKIGFSVPALQLQLHVLHASYYYVVCIEYYNWKLDLFLWDPERTIRNTFIDILYLWGRGTPTKDSQRKQKPGFLVNFTRVNQCPAHKRRVEKNEFRNQFGFCD